MPAVIQENWAKPKRLNLSHQKRWKGTGRPGALSSMLRQYLLNWASSACMAIACISVCKIPGSLLASAHTSCLKTPQTERWPFHWGKWGPSPPDHWGSLQQSFQSYFLCRKREEQQGVCQCQAWRHGHRKGSALLLRGKPFPYPR